MTGRRPGPIGRLGPILRDVLRADPRLAATVVTMRLGAAVLTPLDAVALGLLVDAGLRGDVRAAVGWAALLALSDVGSSALNHPAGKLELTLREKTNFVLEQRLLRVSTAPGSLEHLERPEYHDRIEQARDRSSSLGDLLVRAIALAQAVVLLGAVLFALVSVDWILLALVAAAVPAVYLAGRGEVLRIRGTERAAPSLRLADRLFEIACQAGSVKEVKINRAERLLRVRFGAASREAYRALDTAEARAVAFTVAGWLVFSLTFVLAMGYVVREAAAGRATPGQVLLVLALAIRLTEQVDELSGAVSGVRRAVLDVRRLRWLYEVSGVEPAATQPSPARPEPPRTGPARPDPLRPSPAQLVGAAEPGPSDGRAPGDIVLREVSFRYPGTEVDILRGVSLRLPVGTTVALVGENGAGKTTLVKLLCGLYPPSGGAITVGGMDLRMIGQDRWSAALSASFQDFVRFELLVREAVGVGWLERMDHDGAVRAAIDRAGARQVVEGLPRGLRTQLGPQWPDGAELSLGQWQKLALSRAMMRPYPSLLVLDEPSASLDTAAEHALYERFSRASEFGAATSAITLLVSHRFSTVRMADVIVLLRDGRIGEVGSHDELMRMGGGYAELFELQARGYR
ncbi:ABC transporter ATP-binding protein [Micromonospora sp. DT229]|uniref:ABC transporter ATP-binding protein n=1 Tax=Micromonospora sp. DT229 TaxID=3393430 RepID=UPI003CEDB074